MDRSLAFGLPGRYANVPAAVQGAEPGARLGRQGAVRGAELLMQGLDTPNTAGVHTEDVTVYTQPNEKDHIEFSDSKHNINVSKISIDCHTACGSERALRPGLFIIPAPKY